MAASDKATNIWKSTSRVSHVPPGAPQWGTLPALSLSLSPLPLVWMAEDWWFLATVQECRVVNIKKRWGEAESQGWQKGPTSPTRTLSLPRPVGFIQRSVCVEVFCVGVRGCQSAASEHGLPLYEIRSLPWSHLTEKLLVTTLDSGVLLVSKRSPIFVDTWMAWPVSGRKEPNSSSSSPCSNLNNSEAASLGVSWAGWGTNQGPLSRALLNALNLKWNTKCEFQVWIWCIRKRGGWQPFPSSLPFGSRY